MPTIILTGNTHTQMLHTSYKFV